MARRRTTTEKINPNARKANVKFGWCTTGHHDTCRKEFLDWNNVQQECSCKCHKDKK